MAEPGTSSNPPVAPHPPVAQTTEYYSPQQPAAQPATVNPVPQQQHTPQVNSEKVAVATTEGEATEATTERSLYKSKSAIAIFALLGLLLVGLALGIGLGLGLPQDRIISSSGPYSNTYDPYRPTTRSHSSTRSSTSRSTGVAGLPAPAGSTLTVQLTRGPVGMATGTTTVTSYSHSSPTGLQTVPVFSSSTFHPKSFESTLTYSAAQAGETTGFGLVDCPEGDDAVYFAEDGSVYQKQCYSDLNDSSDRGNSRVASLDECIESCVLSTINDPDSNNGQYPCYAVSYSANLTKAIAGQRANCFWKSYDGTASEGDWQQAIARFIGYAVDVQY